MNQPFKIYLDPDPNGCSWTGATPLSTISVVNGQTIINNPATLQFQTQAGIWILTIPVCGANHIFTTPDTYLGDKNSLLISSCTASSVPPTITNIRAMCSGYQQFTRVGSPSSPGNDGMGNPLCPTSSSAAGLCMVPNKIAAITECDDPVEIYTPCDPCPTPCGFDFPSSLSVTFSICCAGNRQDSGGGPYTGPITPYSTTFTITRISYKRLICPAGSYHNTGDPSYPDSGACVLADPMNPRHAVYRGILALPKPRTVICEQSESDMDDPICPDYEILPGPGGVGTDCRCNSVYFYFVPCFGMWMINADPQDQARRIPHQDLCFLGASQINGQLSTACQPLHFFSTASTQCPGALGAEGGRFYCTPETYFIEITE